MYLASLLAEGPPVSGLGKSLHLLDCGLGRSATCKPDSEKCHISSLNQFAWLIAGSEFDPRLGLRTFTAVLARHWRDSGHWLVRPRRFGLSQLSWPGTREPQALGFFGCPGWPGLLAWPAFARQLPACLGFGEIRDRSHLRSLSPFAPHACRQSL